MPSPRRRRSLGQHFLRNLAAADQIVSNFAPAPGEVVLEIGPGHGVLTERLLAAGARVLAIEKDAAVAATLADRLGADGRLHLVVGDALETPIERLLRTLDAGPAARFRLLANLPYSVGTEIVARALLAAPLFASLTVMLQREVAERICAAPGGKAYGSLSVLSQYYATPRVVMRLAPGSFSPPPKVDSAVVVMPMRDSRELEADAERGYAPFIRSLFHQKRRTLPHNLVPALGRDRASAAARLAALGIDAERRPETLTRAECLRIYSDIIAHQ
ncbi:MAG TPA: 16S rRNA (adenine(1518)-N(6)/adenine(1519)-N(6))-dimethyltransferase RsmA [Verrucomicrobiae bacterium]|nr:16S rRNA (adenine(1518)-N(6)/adenine(1519)-N(6))-dimethyltransferase RsmA [Verrucomicrobiae bacterium]